VAAEPGELERLNGRVDGAERAGAPCPIAKMLY